MWGGLFKLNFEISDKDPRCGNRPLNALEIQPPYPLTGQAASLRRRCWHGSGVDVSSVGHALSRLTLLGRKLCGFDLRLAEIAVPLSHVPRPGG
jgi:hypothetical protein